VTLGMFLSLKYSPQIEIHNQAKS